MPILHSDRNPSSQCCRLSFRHGVESGHGSISRDVRCVHRCLCRGKPFQRSSDDGQCACHDSGLSARTGFRHDLRQGFLTRAQTAPGDLALIVGFSVGPGAEKQILLRAVGPTLATAPFNLPGTLTDPFLTLFAGGTVNATNDNWSTPIGTPVITDATFSSVGAFAFPSNSRDSAILTTLPTGNYTAQVSGAPGGSGTGLAIVEVYEMEGSGAKLKNLSTREQILTGANLMIPGIVVGHGSGTVRLLVRAAGPAIAGAPFNVPGALADPAIILTDSARREIARNDNWEIPVGGNASPGADLTSAFASVGAFPFQAGSRDSALLAPLPSGSYTVQVTGVGGGSGVAVVEVYELP